MKIDKYMTTIEKRLHDAYVDYRNDFLTVGGFADYHGYDDKTASLIIELGRHIDSRHTELNEGMV